MTTEGQKVILFVYRLQKDIDRVMVGQTYTSLSEAIDKARKIELWDKESGSSDIGEQRKKMRMDVP